MEKCHNCSRALSCGCQKRTASNGMQCCAACVSEVEKRIQEEKRIKEQQQKLNP